MTEGGSFTMSKERSHYFLESFGLIEEMRLHVQPPVLRDILLIFSLSALMVDGRI